MSEPTQMTFLQQNLAPNQWLCPGCRGNRTMLRLRYPDELRDGGPVHELCRCRVCDGQGVVDWDPENKSIPY